MALHLLVSAFTFDNVKEAWVLDLPSTGNLIQTANDHNLSCLVPQPAAGINTCTSTVARLVLAPWLLDMQPNQVFDGDFDSVLADLAAKIDESPVKFKVFG